MVFLQGFQGGGGGSRDCAGWWRGRAGRLQSITNLLLEV